MEAIEKLKTLTLKEEEEENDSSISFPIEIIQEILSRLPVKPLLQFRSVSKPWLSLISDDPSFSKLHFTRSTTTPTPFFLSAYDSATQEIHFLSAPHDGGPLTHILTLHDARVDVNARYETTATEHVNGLVLFSIRNGVSIHSRVFVVNPATRKVFKLPLPNSIPFIYFFGFDESKNEHKVLSISGNTKPGKIQCMLFSLSTYSWREIDVVEDEDFPPYLGIVCGINKSVCVNSVIHWILESRNLIWAFDLTTEKFFNINFPQGSLPHEPVTWFTRKGEDMCKCDYPFLMNVNGLLGVVCHDRVTETNEMHIWILQDYVNRVWVRETTTFFESWIELDGLQQRVYHFMESIVFSLRRLSTDMISSFILDMTTKSFKLVNFTLGHQFRHSKTLRFHQVRSYVESLLPLREE